MLDSGEVAMCGYGREVNTTRSCKWFFIIPVDVPPKLSEVVTREHQLNRKQVNRGKIIGWGEHGYVAIVKNSNGVEAAFSSGELNYVTP